MKKQEMEEATQQNCALSDEELASAAGGAIAGGVELIKCSKCGKSYFLGTRCPNCYPGSGSIRC